MNAPVLVHNMSNAAYHAHSAVSSSQLKTILRSPAHFFAEHMSGKEHKQTTAMALGTAVHVLFLEPEVFNDEVAIEPIVNKRTNVGKEAIAKFLQDNASKTIITEEQYQAAAKAAEAMKRHPMYNMILSGGIREASIFFDDEETGLECRIRPDWHVAPETSEYFPNGLIVDIKKTTDARANAFSRSCQNYDYSLLAAMYINGYKAYYGDEYNPSFLFFAVEEDDPHESIIYYASDEMLFIGEQKRRSAMLTLLQCKESNEWQGYTKQIQPIDLPLWAKKEFLGE